MLISCIIIPTCLCFFSWLIIMWVNLLGLSVNEGFSLFTLYALTHVIVSAGFCQTSFFLLFADSNFLQIPNELHQQIAYKWKQAYFKHTVLICCQHVVDSRKIMFLTTCQAQTSRNVQDTKPWCLSKINNINIQ